MKVGTKVFLMVDGAGREGDLVAGTVQTTHWRLGRGRAIIVDLPLGTPVIAGERVVLLYTSGRFFVRQTWRLRSLRMRGGEARARLVPVGKPEKSEERASARVSTVGEGVKARIEHGPECPVLDVGPNGIAVYSPERLPVGRSIRIEFAWNGNRYHGTAMVRNANGQPRGGWRHGLECLPDGPGQDLKKSLRRIWMALQFKTPAGSQA